MSIYYIKMLKIDTSDFQNTLFRKDIAGDNIVGGFPIIKLINDENQERTILGGSNEIGTSRFEGLAVPLGLVVNSPNIDGGCSQLSKIKMITTNEILDDNIFNKLFGMVKKNTTTNNKTKKKRT